MSGEPSSRKPSIHVVQDGAGYDAWFETPTEAARAQVLVLVQAASERQGSPVTEQQLASWLGGVFFSAWGPGLYTLAMHLGGKGAYLTVKDITEEGEQTT